MNPANLQGPLTIALKSPETLLSELAVLPQRARGVALVALVEYAKAQLERSIFSDLEGRLEAAVWLWRLSHELEKTGVSVPSTLEVSNDAP